MAARTLRGVLVRGLTAGVALLVVVGVAGCSDDRPNRADPTVTATAESSARADAVELPEGALRPLAPTPDEVPAGLVPLLQASGPRDAAAVAAFSADTEAAGATLDSHGFADAYVAQYASPSDARTLTVVVAQFAGADGARADFDGDVATSGGEVLDLAPAIGDASDVRRLALPGDEANDLVTVRFRSGATTWLLAWRAPRPADPAIPVDLARRLAERA